MRLFSRILWVGVLWGISLALFVLALGLVPQEDLEATVLGLYESLRLRWGLGAVAVLTGVAGILLLRWAVQQHQRERTIAFRNPDGEVTVSLEAIEDFVKRLGCEQEGVQELRVSASAAREGIVIELRISLWSTCQIPETTERLQNLIQSHVHEMLGVEGPVTVRVHVGRVVRPPRPEAGSDVTQKSFAEKTE